jgi:hypothetical protein
MMGSAASLFAALRPFLVRSGWDPCGEARRPLRSSAYPDFKPSYTHEALVERFLLTPADLQLVWACRGEANQCGMALLLKALTYLGYVPDSLDSVPHDVRSFITGHLGLLWDFSEAYRWDSRTRGQHLLASRQHTGWRFPTGQDKDELERWLRQEAAREVPEAERLLAYACQRLRHVRVELPAERELQRIVDAALKGFFQDLHRRRAEAMPADVRTRIDALLVGPGSGVPSAFEQLKGDPGKPGIKNLQAELAKLRALRSIGLGDEPFAGVPLKVLQLLKRRATNETVSEMRHHLDDMRYALMGCCLPVRALEVTDDVTRMTIDLIQRLSTRSEKQLHRQWLAELERVAGKMPILSDVAEAVIASPDGIVREGIFPRVAEETFRPLVVEFRVTGPQLRLLRQTIMDRKYARHYRRMLPAILASLPFRSDNRFQPIIEVLAFSRGHVGSRSQFFPQTDMVPITGIVTPAWQQKVFEAVKEDTRVNRRYDELCVLQKLQRALKCKEVWVEGSSAFRNPHEDMPGDWSDEHRRLRHYQALNKPLEAQTFVCALTVRLTTALAQFNQALPHLSHLRIIRPKHTPEHGLWALAKLEPQPEPHSLNLIKDAISHRYGILDLLDVFVEADRTVDFTRFFTHSGTKEMRSREALRP